MLIGYLAKQRHIFAKLLDAGKFLSLLRVGKFRIVNILEPSTCVDTHRLEFAARRRRYPYMLPCRRYNEQAYLFEGGFVGDLPAVIAEIAKTPCHCAFAMP